MAGSGIGGNGPLQTEAMGGGWLFSLFGKRASTHDAALAGRRKLYIPEILYRKMLNQCLEERPLEACGLFGGASGHVTMAFATDNAERSPILYRVDERQLITAHREITGARQEIIGIYHSHVKTAPVPSLTDIEQATFPEAFYVIVSLAHRRPVVRAWQIVDRRVTEHMVVIQKELPGTWCDLRAAVRHVAEPTDIR